MFKEKRIVWFHDGSLEGGPLEEAKTSVGIWERIKALAGVIEEKTETVKQDVEFLSDNYAEGVAKMALYAESGQYSKLALEAYSTFLSNPEGMRKYRDIMLKYNPTSWIAKVPGVGTFAKLQTLFVEGAVDTVAGVMEWFKGADENSIVFKALERTKGEWDQMTPEEQKAFMEKVDDDVKGFVGKEDKYVSAEVDNMLSEE